MKAALINWYVSYFVRFLNYLCEKDKEKNGSRYGFFKSLWVKSVEWSRKVKEVHSILGDGETV